MKHVKNFEINEASIGKSIESKKSYEEFVSIADTFCNYELRNFLQEFGDLISYSDDLLDDRDSGLNEKAIDDIESRINDILSEIEQVVSGGYGGYGRNKRGGRYR